MAVDKEVGDSKDFITFAKEAIGLIPLEVKFKKLDNCAVMPSYAHDGDVGMDLTAIRVEYNESKDYYVYHTGLSFETDKHYGIFLFARSSNRNTDAYLCNHVGIADSAIYRGEIMLCFKNRTPLKQEALNAKTEKFFNLIEYGIDMQTAIKRSTEEYERVMKNPMAFAPYKVGDRVAQMVTLPYPNVRLREYFSLSKTERGENGFGSTNIKIK